MKGRLVEPQNSASRFRLRPRFPRHGLSFSHPDRSGSSRLRGEPHHAPLSTVQRRRDFPRGGAANWEIMA